MKRSVLFLGLVFALALPARAEETPNVDRFGAGLTVALQSNHAGLRQAALQHIIHYGDVLGTVVSQRDVARVYHRSGDARMRRLAVVALGRMGTPEALSVLGSIRRSERSVEVVRTIDAILARAAR